MGVKSCSRQGCKSIMCDRHSTKHGYICSDCYVELSDNPFLNIYSFMNTMAGAYKNDDDLETLWTNRLIEEFK